MSALEASSEKLPWKAGLKVRLWRGDSTRIPSYGLIVGAMKAGTTSLFSLLSQHPQICPGRWKEPEFFSKPARWENAGKSYPQLWRFDSDVHSCAIEASTGYSKYSLSHPTDVPSRIASFAEDSGSSIRIIYIMRDPVERVESQIAHQIAKGRADLSNLPPSQLERALDISRYATQLDRYTKVFDADQMLLLNFEDLKQGDNTLSLLDRCRKFLNLERFDFTSEPPQNTRQMQGAPPAALSEDQRRLIRDELLPDTRRLRDEYGFDLSRWQYFGDA